MRWCATTMPLTTWCRTRWSGRCPAGRCGGATAISGPGSSPSSATCISRRCARGKRRGAHVELDEATTPSSAAQQESGIEVQDILAALDQLPEEQKSLLLLVGVEDLSYEDAAKVIGVPAGTVMSRLSRGRQRLRALLETGRTTLLRRVK
jgi:predicted DNA-binding protein (UPF0251 family)